jgi:hypothetical protein
MPLPRCRRSPGHAAWTKTRPPLLAVDPAAPLARAHLVQPAQPEPGDNLLNDPDRGRPQRALARAAKIGGCRYRNGITAADFPGDARLDLTDEFFTREFGLFARCSDNGQPKTSAHAD